MLSSSAPTDISNARDPNAVLALPTLISVEPTSAVDATTVSDPLTESSEQLTCESPNVQHTTAKLALSAATDGYPDKPPCPSSIASAPRDSEPSLDTGGGVGGGDGGGDGGGGDGGGEGGGDGGGGDGGGEGGTGATYNALHATPDAAS